MPVLRRDHSNIGRGNEAVLHFFNDRDGNAPEAALIADSRGSFYGTTVSGGDLSCHDGSGCGVVFKLTRYGRGKYRESTLYRFHGGTDGEFPMAALVADKAGRLYGTT